MGGSGVEATYCETWSWRLRKPTDVMTAEQARSRHARGESYCVVIGDPSAPQAIIDVVPENSYIEVSFVDSAGRTHTAYGFSKVDSSKLFMTEVTVWSYPEGARSKSQASVVESLEYKPDGYLCRRVNDKSLDHIQKTEYTDVPVDVNWEPVPEFGQWESIARENRETPAT